MRLRVLRMLSLRLGVPVSYGEPGGACVLGKAATIHGGTVVHYALAAKHG